MAAYIQRGKPLTQAAGARKQIDDAESGWQVRNLSNSDQWLYTKSIAEARSEVADIVDSQTRSRMMAGIRGKDTKPELALRRALHAQGFRYRLHAKGIPGKPDLVLPKYRAVLFVHGCFWHRHPGCRYSTTPATRPELWAAKFNANVTRDKAVRSTLLRAGWRVATIWECALRNDESVAAAQEIVAAWLYGLGLQLETGEADIRMDKGSCSTVKRE